MSGKPRGRPRAFDAEEVLGKALDVFWTQGFEATSLDDLSAATGLARPSLYAAFGNKEDLYVQAMALISERMTERFKASFFPERPLKEGLISFYRAAIDLYVSGPKQRGCLVICTAISAAPDHENIRAKLNEVLKTLDAGFQSVMKRAQARGELPAKADPATFALLASATLQSLAIRARAGECRQQLEDLAGNAVETLFPFGAGNSAGE